ncbi:MAG TPA: MMPL family transporter [bacterium]|nr:MMPL family transporter [bacterium]
MATSRNPLFSKIEKVIIDYPFLVLLVGLIITLYFARLIPEIRFSSSSDEFFIAGDPDKAYYEKAKELFGNDQVVMAAYIAPEGQTIYNAPALEKLDRLTQALAKVDGVKTVVSLANISDIRAPRDPVTGGFKKTIEVKKLISAIPRTGEQWQALRAEIARNPLYRKNFVSEDGRAAAIAVFIRDFDQQSERYDQVVADINSIVMKEDGGKGIYLAGVPVTRVAMVQRMTQDIKRLLPLSFLLIVITLVLGFRTFRGVLLPLLIIITTTVWAVGFMKAVGISITMVTMILPPLMLALASSYSMHLMSEYQAEADPGISNRVLIANVLGRVTLPIFICGITTIIGFASFIPNKIPAIKDLGLASVAGIFFAMLIAIFAMPSILVMLSPPKPQAVRRTRPGAVDRFLERLARLNLMHGRAIFVAAVLLVIISIYGISRIRIDTDFLSFFAAADPVVKAVNIQTEHLAGPAPFNIVLEADRPDAFKDPGALKRLEKLQRYAETRVEGIDTTVSMADYVKLLNQAFHQNDPAYFKIPDTRKEVSQLLLFYANSGSPDDFAPYMTSNYSAANILIRSRLVGSTETMRAINQIEERAAGIFQPPPLKPAPGGKALAQVPAMLPHQPAPPPEPPPPPKTDGGEEVIDWGDETAAGKEAPATLPRAAPEPIEPAASEPSAPRYDWPIVQVHVTGTIFLMNKSADAVAKGQISSLVFAIAAVFLIMAILFLSFKVGLLSMLPSIFTVSILFGIMGITGISLNFATSLIAGIAIGIGIDDTIHYISRYNAEVQRTHDQNQAMIAALKAMGKPMIFTTVALFFGFIILAASDFVPIRQFGVLAGVSMIVANVSNIVLLPTLMLSVRIITLWDLLGLSLGDSPARYIKIFNGLTNHQARLAVLMGYIKEFKNDDWIIKEGEMGNEMYVVLKGYVHIIKREEGRDITVFTIQPGDAFGEMGLLRHTTRSASARAEAEGNVKILVLDEQTLARIQKRYPRISSQIYHNITSMLSERVSTATSQYLECAFNVPDDLTPKDA